MITSKGRKFIDKLGKLSPKSLSQFIQADDFLSWKRFHNQHHPLALIISKVLYKFAPNVNVIKGPYSPNSLIIIQANNLAFSNIILKQFTNSGNEDFINYVKSCTLRYAFPDFPEPFYPKQVCELYYSCFIDSSAQTITRTTGDDQSRVTIDA